MPRISFKKDEVIILHQAITELRRNYQMMESIFLNEFKHEGYNRDFYLPNVKALGCIIGKLYRAKEDV